MPPRPRIHRPPGRPAPAEAKAQADRRRGSAASRGYGRRWEVYRLAFLRRNPLCACGCGGAAEHVNHIVAVAGPSDPLFWEPTNHQGLTHACHSRKTALEDGGFGRTPRTKG